MKSRVAELNRCSYTQDGYFTSKQAGQYGVSPQLLAHHVRAGHYERVSRGVYRLVGFPGSSREEIRAKWLWVGPDRAVISHESALEMHGISDVLPNKIHMLVSRKDRGMKPPRGVVLHTTKKPLDQHKIVVIDGFKVTSIEDSIIDAANTGTQPEQIQIAIDQGIDQGIINPDDLKARATKNKRLLDLIENSIKES